MHSPSPTVPPVQIRGRTSGVPHNGKGLAMPDYSLEDYHPYRAVLAQYSYITYLQVWRCVFRSPTYFHKVISVLM